MATKKCVPAVTMATITDLNSIPAKHAKKHFNHSDEERRVYPKNPGRTGEKQLHLKWVSFKGRVDGVFESTGVSPNLPPLILIILTA